MAHMTSSLSSTSTRMQFDTYYQFGMDQALVLDRNWKEKNATNRIANQLQQSSNKDKSNNSKTNNNNNSKSKVKGRQMEKTPGFNWDFLPKEKWNKMSDDDRKKHIAKQRERLNEFKRKNNIQNNSNFNSTNSNSNQGSSQQNLQHSNNSHVQNLPTATAIEPSTPQETK